MILKIYHSMFGHFWRAVSPCAPLQNVRVWTEGTLAFSSPRDAPIHLIYRPPPDDTEPNDCTLGMAAEVVYSSNNGQNGPQGRLFAGLKFWLAVRVPQRTRFMQDIKACFSPTVCPAR